MLSQQPYTYMTGTTIIIFLLLINFVLKMDGIKASLPVPDSRLSSCAVPLPTVSRCYWWPFCKSDTSICNGNQKSLCSVYGTNGSKRSEAPSESALACAVYHDRKWKQSSKDRICSWGCDFVRKFPYEFICVHLYVDGLTYDHGK